MARASGQCQRIDRLPLAYIRCSFRYSPGGGSLNQPTGLALCILPDPRSLICRKRGCDNMNGTVLVFAHYPAWLSHRGSSGDKDLSAQTGGPDEHETNRRLVVNTAAACLRGFRLAKAGHIGTTTRDWSCRSREKQETAPVHHKNGMDTFNRIAADVCLDAS